MNRKHLLIVIAFVLAFTTSVKSVGALSSMASSSVCVGVCLTTAYGGWPVDGEKSVSSCQGRRERPCPKCSEVHKGMDIPAPVGTPIYAMTSGTVTGAAYESCGGNTLTITDSVGYRFQSLHMSSFSVEVGAYVEAGALIGKSGNTGECTTGPHLHFQVMSAGKYLNPCCFLDCSDVKSWGKNCARNNFNGASLF